MIVVAKLSKQVLPSKDAMKMVRTNILSLLSSIIYGTWYAPEILASRIYIPSSNSSHFIIYIHTESIAYQTSTYVPKTLL